MQPKFHMTIVAVKESPNSHTVRMFMIVTRSKADISNAVRKAINKRGIDTSSPKNLIALGEVSSLQECERVVREFNDHVKHKAEREGIPIRIE